MSAGILTPALDDGWVLDEPAPAPAAAPILTLVADAPDEFPDMVLDEPARAPSLDDGWALDVEDPPAAVQTSGVIVVADSFDEYPDVVPEQAHDGWFVEADERAPTMELSDEEQAFFDTGEQLATEPPRVDSFDDLAPGPAPGFWQRLLRRR